MKDDSMTAQCLFPITAYVMSAVMQMQKKILCCFGDGQNFAK